MKNKTTTKENGAAKTAKTTTTAPLIDHKTSCALIRLNNTRDRFIARCSKLYSQGTDIAAELKLAEISPHAIPRRVSIMVAEQKADRATVKCEVEIPAWVYGYLCAAAAIHGHADHKAMLIEYLKSTVTEWSNKGYYLED